MKYLNLGCGNIFIDSSDWKNVDQSPFDARVKRADLTKRLPFANQSFDVIYSSHVLEHINRDHVPILLAECNRLLRRGGKIRIVVPDFYEMITSYLAYVETGQWVKARFVKDEILDQCVREKSGGKLLYWYDLAKGDEILRKFISDRNGHFITKTNAENREDSRRANLDINRVWRACTRRYFLFLTKLLPPEYRKNLVSFTHLGELHKWVYDFREMETLLEQAGFWDVVKVEANLSQIKDFPMIPLDITDSGHVRKGRQSMYIEATRK